MVTPAHQAEEPKDSQTLQQHPDCPKIDCVYPYAQWFRYSSEFALACRRFFLFLGPASIAALTSFEAGISTGDAGTRVILPLDFASEFSPAAIQFDIVYDGASLETDPETVAGGEVVFP